MKVREDKLYFAWLQNTNATLGIFSETKSWAKGHCGQGVWCICVNCNLQCFHFSSEKQCLQQLYAEHIWFISALYLKN